MLQSYRYFCRMLGVVLLLVGTSPLNTLAQEGERVDDVTTSKSDHDQVMDEMRTEIESAKVFLMDGTSKGAELRLLDRNLFRYNSPTRQYPDGSLWVWMAEGRPITFAKIFLFGAPGTLRWVWTCASTEPIEMLVRGVRTWYPREGGIVFRQLTTGPEPAENEVTRMRQMKLLLRRVSGHEFWYPGNTRQGRTRQELRVIPQPLMRYKDTRQAVIDGGVFLMVYETEPECVLILRAVANEEKREWQYAALAIGSAEFHIEFDQKEFYTRAWAKNNVGLPTESYHVIITPRRQ